jgi:hypothetical protein
MNLLIYLGGALTVAVIAGLYLAYRAWKKFKETGKRHERAVAQYRSAQEQYRQKGKAAEEAIDDLGKTKLVATVSMERAADLLGKARLTNREILKSSDIKAEKLTEWNVVSINATEIFNAIVSSRMDGGAPAAGVYGLVKLLSTAAPGTSIATLSAAAATNSALAWFRGGSIPVGKSGGSGAGAEKLGGTVAGPVVLETGAKDYFQAKKFKAAVEKEIAEIDATIQEIKRREKGLNLAAARAGEIKRSIEEEKEGLDAQIGAARNIATMLATTAELERQRKGLTVPPEASGNIKRCIEELKKALDELITYDTYYNIYKAVDALAELIDISILDKEGRVLGEGEEEPSGRTD